MGLSQQLILQRKEEVKFLKGYLERKRLKQRKQEKEKRMSYGKSISL